MSKRIVAMLTLCLTTTFVVAAEPTPTTTSSAPTKQATIKQSEKSYAKVRVPADHTGGIITNMLVQTNQSKGGGWPVVLVKSEIPKSFWWVQKVEAYKPGVFKARVHLGNDKTEDRSKFRLVALIFDDKVAADKYRTGSTLTRLPSDVPRSKNVYLMLVRESKTEPVDPKEAKQKLATGK